MPEIRKKILATLLAFFAAGLAAQAQQGGYKSPCSNPASLTTRTFFLSNTPLPADQNEILTTIRDLIDPCIKMHLVSSQSAIVMGAPADQLAIAEKIIQDLDRPEKTYRLHLTVTDSDGAQKVGTRLYALDLAPGQHTVLTQGVRLPVAKTTYSVKDYLKDPTAQTEFTYLDVGLNIDAMLQPYPNGLRLFAKVEQTMVSPEKSATAPQNPILNQNILEGFTNVAIGKPTLLGSLDIPGTNHRLEVSVTLEITP